MYYRIAIQQNALPAWQWESRVIISLDVLFRVLRLYRTMPRNHIRVFFSSSVECLDLMLTRENEGLESSSITADRLLNDRSSINQLEMTRLELELSTPGDHDTPYKFTLPTSMPQILVWAKLLSRIHHRELLL